MTTTCSKCGTIGLWGDGWVVEGLLMASGTKHVTAYLCPACANGKPKAISYAVETCFGTISGDQLDQLKKHIRALPTLVGGEGSGPWDRIHRLTPAELAEAFRTLKMPETQSPTFEL